MSSKAIAEDVTLVARTAISLSSRMKWQTSFVPPSRPVGLRQTSSLPEIPLMSPTNTHAPLHRASLPPLQPARLVMATATAVARPRPVIGFVHLFLSFVAGGMFFGALFAGFTTFVAVGKSNISQLWSIAKSVIHRVWTVFCFGLNETRLALRMDGKWQWREAWKVFQKKMGETRKAAAEGMDALKAENQLYAGVVGEPGLITAQYFLDRLMPFSLTTQMENALKNSLQGVKNDQIRRVSLEDFSTGGVPPQLLEARAYDLGKDALAFDVDVKWESKVYAKLKVTTRHLGIKVPVKVRNPTFEGTARVVMSPLTKEPPGWGAILVSLPSIPKIGLDVQAVGGDLTKVPWLKKEIMKGLQQQIQEQFLWPKRIVLPSLAVPPTAKTVIPKKELDQLANTDPLLEKENTLEQSPALKDHVSEMKPDVSALSSSLQVSVGDGDDVVNGNTKTQSVNGTTTVNGKKAPISIIDKGKKSKPFMSLIPHYNNSSKPFMNLIPHYKNSTKTEG